MFENWNHFIRPNLWIYIVAIFIIGAISSGIYLDNYIIGVIVSVLLCTSSITLNHFFDVETDKKSKQLYRFPVASGKISKRLALWFSIIVIVLSLGLTYMFLNTISLYLVIFANFMIYSYSAPPLRIKEKPYLETLWNAIGYGWIPFYLALFISGISISLSHNLLGLIPFLISGYGHILLQIRDIEDDKKGGVRTTSTKHGLKVMKRLSELLIGFSGLIIIYLALISFLSYFAWLAILIGVIIGFVHNGMKNNVEKSYRKLQILYVIGGIFFIFSLFSI